MHVRPRHWLASLGLLLWAGAAPNPVFGSAVPGAEGRWEGVVLTKPARLEVDMTLEIVKETDGWAGYLSVPAQEIDHRRLDELTVDGPQVSFLYKDPTGDSRFTGFVSNETLSGDFSEGGSTFLCRFSRASGSATRAIPALHDLGADGGDLRSLFNADKARPRLLLILSPTCFECKVSAMMVQRYLLTGDTSPDLRVYVVWEPAQGHDAGEGRSGAANAAALLRDDPRVHQFWSSSRFAGNAFKDRLGLSSPAWDVFLLFAPGGEWTTEAPPPAFSMNNRSHDPERQLDAKVLAARVKGMTSTEN